MKRNVLLPSLGLGIVPMLILFVFANTNSVLAGPGQPPPSTELTSSLTPVQTATLTLTITPTYTSTSTATPTITATITSSPTATYDISKLYPTQNSDADTQTQLINIQYAIIKLQEYIETSQPNNSQLQDALNAIKDSLAATEQQAKTDKLEQSIIGWIQFAIGLILGALLGWINIEPPLPAIRRDLIEKKLRQFAKMAKEKISWNSSNKKNKTKKIT